MVYVLETLNMNDVVPVRRKNQNIDKRVLRKMVKSLVTDMESLQDEIVLVLDDMKDLVGQIDHVSSKLDVVFGLKWKEDGELDRKSPKHSNHSLPEHHYVNIDLRPTIQNIEQKINSKLCSRRRHSADKNMANYDREIIRGIGEKASRPNSFEGKLEDAKPKTKSPVFHSLKTDKLTDRLESPMLDLSYLGINQAYDRPRWGRSISLPIEVKSPKVSPLQSPFIRSNLQFTKNNEIICEEFRTPKATCFAELKRNYISKNSICSNTSDDVFNDADIKTSSPATGTTVKTLTSSSVISNVSIDGDLYERNLDNELENIEGTSDDSLLLETSDDSMETGSNTQTDPYLGYVERRYDTNTWTSFSLNHMTDSAKSLDSFVSDTSSDIMNDNIWPPSNIGDMFSNSMLAKKFNKRLDNDYSTINGDLNFN